MSTLNHDRALPQADDRFELVERVSAARSDRGQELARGDYLVCFALDGYQRRLPSIGAGLVRSRKEV
jgi:hypothetical protein